ncbi:MAG: SH3 type 3 domain protein [candidate division WWE3 bacterium GW2011_GWA1_41_8]|uniref:SH3 type 3 domain protein n=1 Tax=candidate division WWE3 bacterium GW2011_GWA1_41_8 TaxID=1619103 RepID=A0A0G0XA64_UNCKA|nr:MAG: SH3 type 3 domain protein [candidate division WWE3 bacterium GW2011_GWA1_41_8]
MSLLRISILSLIILFILSGFSLLSYRNSEPAEIIKGIVEQGPVNKNALNQVLGKEEGEEGDTTVLMATGDVLLARSVNGQIDKRKDPTWPFHNVKNILTSTDITLVNLENPLIEKCPLSSEGFKFCGNTSNIDGLLYAGVDVVNIANNHTNNYGYDGVVQTINALSEKGFLISGTDEQPVYKIVNGIKFSFLGFNDIGPVERGLAFADENSIKVIIGNHPHWEQSEEYYKGKFIKYSHGNFVFDQMWSEETRKGVVGKYTFKNNILEKVEMIPIYIQNYGQPEVVSK